MCARMESAEFAVALGMEGMTLGSFNSITHWQRLRLELVAHGLVFGIISGLADVANIVAPGTMNSTSARTVSFSLCKCGRSSSGK